MKKALYFFSGVLLMASTNYYSFSQAPGKKTVTKTTKTTSTKSTAGAAKTTISKEDIAEGQELVSKSDCLSCHQPKMKVVGPAYNAVAAKYPATEANIAKLSQKIIKGGAGTWGQIPMSAHPQIADADAQKMVKYVLSLKGK